LFGGPEPTGTANGSHDENIPSSLGPSLRSLSIFALYPAFPGASTLQTADVYLNQICYSREKLEITKLDFHMILAHEGQAQEGLDMLCTFIEQKINGSLVQFLNLGVLIFDEMGASFEKLATSLSAFSTLKFLVLHLLPWTDDMNDASFMRLTCEHAEAFIVMMLESVVSTKLQTVFFMVESVPEVKDLVSLNWAAFGKSLTRPEYVNLASVALDCTGKTSEWAEDAIPCMEVHVRKHIPPHIALTVGGITPTGPISLDSNAL
ncbi:hypothetical protein DL96DRAFT_1608303, partial [Flagelloscypha sp. PMI_526]